MNKIVNKLYLGNLYEVIHYGDEFDFVVSVMHPSEMDRFEMQDYAQLKTIVVTAPVLRETTEWKEEIKTHIVKDVWLEPTVMDFVSQFLYNHREHKCLIHCAASMERSPAAMVWFLYQNPNLIPQEATYIDGQYKVKLTIDQVYDFVKSKHPQTLYRIEWFKRLLSYNPLFTE